jgi:hypothetical protein
LATLVSLFRADTFVIYICQLLIDDRIIFFVLVLVLHLFFFLFLLNLFANDLHLLNLLLFDLVPQLPAVKLGLNHVQVGLLGLMIGDRRQGHLRFQNVSQRCRTTLLGKKSAGRGLRDPSFIIVVVSRVYLREGVF